MTDADDDMFAGMIQEALNAREAPAPIARAVTDSSAVMAQAEKAAAVVETWSDAKKDYANRAAKATLCPCGSGQYPYNLFDHKGELLLYCCHVCEKPRRKQLNDGGETLTKDG